MTVPGTNEALADWACQLVQSHPPRTPERRAAAACWTALITTSTIRAAHQALSTFSDPGTRAAAAVLLGKLERGTAATAPRVPAVDQGSRDNTDEETRR